MHVGFRSWSARAVRLLVLASLVAGVIGFRGSAGRLPERSNAHRQGRSGAWHRLRRLGRRPSRKNASDTRLESRSAQGRPHEPRPGRLGLPVVRRFRDHVDAGHREVPRSGVRRRPPDVPRDLPGDRREPPTQKVRFRGFDDLSVTAPGQARANALLIVGNQLLFQRLTFIEEPKPAGQLADRFRRATAGQGARDHEECPRDRDRKPLQPRCADRPTTERSTSTSVIPIPRTTSCSSSSSRMASTTSALLTSEGPGFPDGVTYLGQVTIPARGSGSMVLVGLKPGTYAIVDLLPSDNGVPHLAVGMSATPDDHGAVTADWYACRSPALRPAQRERLLPDMTLSVPEDQLTGAGNHGRPSSPPCRLVRLLRDESSAHPFATTIAAAWSCYGAKPAKVENVLKLGAQSRVRTNQSAEAVADRADRRERALAALRRSLRRRAPHDLAARQFHLRARQRLAGSPSGRSSTPTRFYNSEQVSQRYREVSGDGRWSRPISRRRSSRSTAPQSSEAWRATAADRDPLSRRLAGLHAGLPGARQGEGRRGGAPRSPTRCRRRRRRSRATSCRWPHRRTSITRSMG